MGGRGSRERGRPARLFRRSGNHRQCSRDAATPLDDKARAMLFGEQQYKQR